MSPNMQLKGLLKRAWIAYRDLRSSLQPKAKKQRKHRLNSHAESVYVWALLDQKFGTETSQEMRLAAANNRGNRSRVNGFVTVNMVLGRGDA